MWTFIFGFMGVCLAIGVLLGMLTIPAYIYTIPYQCWIEGQKKQCNIPQKLESETWVENVYFDGAAGPQLKRLGRSCVNATKLYRSWITKKPHGITKF